MSCERMDDESFAICMMNEHWSAKWYENKWPITYIKWQYEMKCERKWRGEQWTRIKNIINIKHTQPMSEREQQQKRNQLQNKVAAYTKIAQLNNPPGFVSLDYMNDERITCLETANSQRKKKSVFFSICKVTLDICLILVDFIFLIRKRITTMLELRSVFVSIWTNRQICWRFGLLNSSKASETFNIVLWIREFQFKIKKKNKLISILISLEFSRMIENRQTKKMHVNLSIWLKLSSVINLAHKNEIKKIRRYEEKTKRNLILVDAVQTNLHFFILKLSLWMIFINRLLFKFDHLVDCRSADWVCLFDYLHWNGNRQEPIKEEFQRIFWAFFFLLLSFHLVLIFILTHKMNSNSFVLHFAFKINNIRFVDSFSSQKLWTMKMNNEHNLFSYATTRREKSISVV